MSSNRTLQITSVHIKPACVGSRAKDAILLAVVEFAVGPTGPTRGWAERVDENRLHFVAVAQQLPAKAVRGSMQVP
jgi:hypothetical protein